MVEVPIPKSAEARSLFALSLLLYMSGNEMPLMEIFHKSPDDESNGLRPKWESYEAPPPTPHTYILIVGLGGGPFRPLFSLTSPYFKKCIQQDSKFMYIKVPVTDTSLDMIMPRGFWN